MRLVLDRKAFKVVAELDEIAEFEILGEAAGGTEILLFIEAGGLGLLRRRVEAYLDPARDGEKNPAYAAFLDAWDTIQRATFDQFWRDADSRRPTDPQEPIWWEVWLWGGGGRTLRESEEIFRSAGKRLGLRVRDEAHRFPERSVVLAFGPEAAMRPSVELLDCVAALYRADESLKGWLEDLDVTELREFVDDLAERTTPAQQDAPAVCLLDTGVAAAHRLLQRALDQRDCLASHGGEHWRTLPDKAHRKWGARPQDAHGTAMAGIALYGERLAELLRSREPVSLNHGLESVRVRPTHPLLEPSSDPEVQPHGVEPELWGMVTTNAVMLIEEQNPERSRVYCHTPTDQRGRREDGLTEDFGSGLPGSWSAALDDLAFGNPNANPRLFFQSAGNVELSRAELYPAINETSPVEPPGQAWNVLTVGAMTDKVMLDGVRFPGHQPVVRERGALGPESRTSLVWDKGVALKPELVLEGGNLAAPASGETRRDADELRLLTTNYLPGKHPLTTTGDTSAAAALGARAAAMILAEYPAIWPETVRGLLVHTAEWTEQMLKDAVGDRQRTLVGDHRAALLKKLDQKDEERGIGPSQRKRNLLRTVGYGVPDLDRALEGARNAVTMVIQDELQPFVAPESPNGMPGFGGMHLHPISCWPLKLLQGLGETPVTMRVTLSYFIEPNPIGRLAAYASHGLRFDVRRPTEADDGFIKRISRVVAEGTEPGETTSSTPNHDWYLGPGLQSAGSIHSDWWSGTASRLANCGLLAVYPVSGWWRTRKGQKKWQSRARYSLIVSLSTPAQTVDLYSAVRVKLRPEISLVG